MLAKIKFVLKLFKQIVFHKLQYEILNKVIIQLIKGSDHRPRKPNMKIL